ncbi:AraC-like DNA-binding protein [Porphyrobacter sp. MBR-155]|jgi:AraC-like DNA-binding protein|uniref:helix-turn-helix domain-containing protein n=1 Tax=Porphyrobacter sp. MBR-155 TaxID=3156464 RepID=UPI0033972B8F
MGDRFDSRVIGGRLPLAGYRLHAEFREPPAQFEGCFTTFYHLALDLDDPASPLTDYLQPEWGNIRFFCGSAPDAEIGAIRVSGAPFVATGPSALPCRFTLGPVRMWGVGFLPLGWARFMRSDARSCANIICDGAAHFAFQHFAGLTDTLCNPQASMDEQFDAIVNAMTQMMRPTRDDARIARVHRELVNSEHASVRDLADSCAMSIRMLERLSTKYFGFSPKLLMRRQRFMRSLTTYMLHHGSHWTEVMDAHYHDQAQFTREFHEFMTMNPSEYAALDHPILKSFMEARARMWGSAAQTLDAAPPP